ncbi:hypothetical protein QQF64_016965 [Cirrhinus molitorella]|uniref:Uncharacterized protein n=1 Tax=Cirrhinus molitorella TaxID=172907 RepID=A0ABR3LPB4_9TELE
MNKLKRLAIRGRCGDMSTNCVRFVFSLRAEVHVPHGSELIIHSSADGRVEEKSGSDPVQTNIFIFCHSQPEPLS